MAPKEVIEEERADDVITTGHGEIDKKLGGGIPMGSLILIEGQSDAGKSVVSQQLIWGSLTGNHRVLLFTNENTVKSMNTQMESLGLSILDSLLMGYIKIFPIESTHMKNDDALDGIIESIQLYQDYNLIVVDSLTPIVAHATTDEVIAYFEKCKRLCDQRKTIINTAHTYAFDEQLLIRIRSACDAHLRLRIEEVGDKLIKVLEVAKIRGADKNTGNVVSFDVDPGIGMRVMPMGKAKA
jgi:flagellar protein FlaH